MMTETNVKSLELLKEALPSITRVGVLYEPATPSHAPGLKAAEEAGPELGLRFGPWQRIPEPISRTRFR